MNNHDFRPETETTADLLEALEDRLQDMNLGLPNLMKSGSPEICQIATDLKQKVYPALLIAREVRKRQFKSLQKSGS